MTTVTIRSKEWVSNHPECTRVMLLLSAIDFMGDKIERAANTIASAINKKEERF